jgi:hypothetical protein
MHQINFSPFANNVIDYIDTPLINVSGESVTVKDDGHGGFNVFVNDKIVYQRGGNLDTSYFLNMMETGVKE